MTDLSLKQTFYGITTALVPVIPTEGKTHAIATPALIPVSLHLLCLPFHLLHVRDDERPTQNTFFLESYALSKPDGWLVVHVCGLANAA